MGQVRDNDTDVSNFEGLPRGAEPQRGWQRQSNARTLRETLGLQGGTRVATGAKCYAYAFAPAFATVVGTNWGLFAG